MGKTAMNFRISGKLGEKIGYTPEQEIPMHENPYLDWSAHLFRAPRKQFILFTNTASLYSIVLPGRGITHEGELFKRSIRVLEDMLEEDGFDLIFKRILAPVWGEFHLGKALNRSVIGSMNDLVKLAQNRLEDGELSPFATARKLNETPFSYLDYAYPKEAFRSLDVEDVEIQ